MRTILAALLLVQAAPAQSEADKLEAALKKFGERDYTVRSEGTPFATLRLNTRIEKQDDMSIVVFEDSIIYWTATEASTLLEKASLDRLRLISTERKGKLLDGDLFRTLSVEGGKAILTGKEEKQTVAVTSSTIGASAAMRLVCFAEQKEGAAFKVDVLNMDSGLLEPGHAFRCLGKEQVDLNGKKVDAFKWEEKGEWKCEPKVGDRPAVHPEKVDNTYWVSPEGYLVRFTQSPKRDMVLYTK